MTDEERIGLQQRVRELLSHVELTNVRVTELSAERLLPEEAASVKLASQSAYLASEDFFGNRYEWEAELLSQADQTVARIRATLLVEYDLRPGYEPDQEAAEAVSESTGYFAAYPYVRELFQSTCARLQLNPLVLGMLFKDATKPRAVTMAASRAESRGMAEGSGSSSAVDAHEA